MSSIRNRKILTACFALSLCLHIAALGFWNRYAIWFGSIQTIKEAADWVGLTGKQQKDEILKTAFERLTDSFEAMQQEEVFVNLKPPTIAEVSIEKTSFEPPSWPEQELGLKFFSSASFALPKDSFNLLDYLPKDFKFAETSEEKDFSVTPTTAAFPLSLANPVKEFQPISSHRMDYETPFELFSLPKPEMEKTSNVAAFLDLPQLPTLEELDTESCSDAFDAELTFLPKENGEGYIFALTLIPKAQLQVPRIRNNVIFLIDRSNSIQQSRLSATKAAVHKALEELGDEDTFNIIAFDSKIEKMSPHAMTRSTRSLAMAEAFLEKIQLGSFFSNADLYRPLFLTVPGQVKPDELYTAILLTDGESLVRKNAQSALLSDWTLYNQGKVSLYIIGMNDVQAPVLEVAASLNKGKLVHASANRGIKRKLLKLMKTIQDPIAKNISCKAISKLPHTHVKIMAKPTQLPNLYLNQPYAILGEADTLDDFILFVQGRLRGKWINIKKTISFLNAKKGNKVLKQEWAMQKALHFYEKFLLEQNAEYIAEAKALLEPLDLPVVIQ
jgi:hypothetical protein